MQLDFLVMLLYIYIDYGGFFQMIRNTELFTQKSDDYFKFRPSYPVEAVEWLKSEIAAVNALDIGAGTGIFTKVLLKCFKNVSALEPNADMRNKFSQFLPDVPCYDGCGENTLLPDNSVDLITVAQAFHWLDADLFKKEAIRILKPQGKVAIVWNTSLKSDFTVERNAVCQKYCPRFAAGHAGKLSAEEGDIFLREKFFSTVKVVSFDNPFSMDQATFEGNMRSRSYALTPGDSKYSAFMAELRTVFEKHSQNGIVTEPQETQIYLGSF